MTWSNISEIENRFKLICIRTYVQIAYLSLVLATWQRLGWPRTTNVEMRRWSSEMYHGALGWVVLMGFTQDSEYTQMHPHQWDWQRYYKLIYSEFIKKYEHLRINWCTQSNKDIYNTIVDYLYGGNIVYRDLSMTESDEVTKKIWGSLISETLRDFMWLVAVRRLPVRAVVIWSCYVTTKKCPMPLCNCDETLEHLLLECSRTKEVWKDMQRIGVTIRLEPRSIFYGILDSCVAEKHRDLFFQVISAWLITKYGKLGARCLWTTLWSTATRW